jgi:hypothetical protein
MRVGETKKSITWLTPTLKGNVRLISIAICIEEYFEQPKKVFKKSQPFVPLNLIRDYAEWVELARRFQRLKLFEKGMYQNPMRQIVSRAKLLPFCIGL